jgi:S-formylglutathione hydrolase FrmB
MLRFLLLCCLCLFATAIPASDAASDTASDPTSLRRGALRHEAFWSPALGVRKQVQVYLPPSYHRRGSERVRYPVAVYLHGKWGNETDWVEKGRLAVTMDSLISAGMPEMLVVMPDGDDGWWTSWAQPTDLALCQRTPHRGEPADQFCVPSPHYDTYVVRDLIAYIDGGYRTIARPESRAIGGVSMGGYGAITLAARYPDVFSAAASHAGILSPGLLADSSTIATSGRVTWRASRTTIELQRATGARWEGMAPMFGVDPSTWQSRDPARLLLALQERGGPLPSLHVDVARGDEVLKQNRLFRAALAEHGIPLSYVESDGAHTWENYRASLSHSLHFLSDHLAHAPPAQ